MESSFADMVLQRELLLGPEGVRIRNPGAPIPHVR